MNYLNDNRNCLYVAGIEEESVVDGPGIRFTIFTQGCNHHCKGCHNPETWDYSPEVLKDKVNYSIKKDELKTMSKSTKQAIEYYLKGEINGVRINY